MGVNNLYFILKAATSKKFSFKINFQVFIQTRILNKLPECPDQLLVQQMLGVVGDRQAQELRRGPVEAAVQFDNVKLQLQPEQQVELEELAQGVCGGFTQMILLE